MRVMGELNRAGLNRVALVSVGEEQMNMDRAEFAGTGAALAFHVALIAAMSISLARVANAPEPPAMEVELVEDVGLQSAAPAAAAAAQPGSRNRRGPVIEPTPAPAVMPTTPAPRVTPTPARPQKPAPAAKAPRVSRIGDDFLKGHRRSARRRQGRPAAAKFERAPRPASPN